MQKVICLCDCHLRLHLCKGTSNGQQEHDYQTRLLAFWWWPRRSKCMREDLCRSSGIAEAKRCATILHPQTVQGELQMPDSKWDLLLQQVKGLRHFCTCKTAKLTCNITLLPGATRSAANVLIHKHLLQERMTVQSQISLSILTQCKSNFRFSLEN